MFGAGEWSLFEMDMKIKFTKENVDLYTIKGYSVIGKSYWQYLIHHLYISYVIREFGDFVRNVYFYQGVIILLDLCE